jgi:hypothetical protein
LCGLLRNAIYCPQEYLVTFDTEVSYLVEPARVSLPRYSVCPAEPNVMTLSSSDTKEALELLFPSPTLYHPLFAS